MSTNPRIIRNYTAYELTGDGGRFYIPAYEAQVISAVFGDTWIGRAGIRLELPPKTIHQAYSFPTRKKNDRYGRPVNAIEDAAKRNSKTKRDYLNITE